MHARLALVLSILLIVAALLFALLWSRPSVPSVAEPTQAHAEAPPAKSVELATPEESSDASRAPQDAAASEAPAATTTATLIVICRAKETSALLADIEVQLAPMNPKLGVIPEPPGTRGQLGDMLLTTAEGRVEFDIPATVSAKLSVYSKEHGKCGYASREIAPLTPGERRELVVDLLTQDDGHCYFRVLARETKLPCVGAHVLVDGEKSSSLRCDADGRFDLAFASWATKRVRIHEGGFSDALVAARIRHDRPDTALEILLERGATLIGVLDGKPDTKGKPLVLEVLTPTYRLQQQLELNGDFDIGDTSWRQKFDESGRALLSDVLPGAPLRITVSKGRAIVLALTEEITLEPGETREITLHIDDGCKISGNVRDTEQRPVAQQELWLLRGDKDRHKYFTISDDSEAVAKTKTDAEGHYAFEHVQAGSWRLGPAYEFISNDFDGSKTASALAPVATEVDVAGGTAAQTVDLIVYRGLMIRGRVLDPTGAPSAKAIVVGWGGDLFVFSSPQADGAFLLGPLVPGTCKLTANCHGEFASSEMVQADAGAKDVVLRLRAGASLSGRVVDAVSGEACSAEMVQSTPEDPFGQISLAQTNSDGTFKIEGLLPGRVALAVHTNDGRTGLLPDLLLASGTKLENLVLPVSRGAKLRLRYEGKAAGGQVLIRHDGVVFVDDGIESRTGRTFVVPAGAMRVEFQIYALKKKLERELTLNAGEEREIVFKDDE